MSKARPILQAVLAATLLLSASPAVAAQSTNTLTEEDKTAAESETEGATTWGVTCDHDVTGKKTGCRVTQTVVARDTGSRLILVSVRRTPDKEPATLLVTLPLRTFLVPGTLIQIDEHPGWKVPFQLCDENGCYAGLSVDDDQVASLRKGTTLSVEFFDEKRRKTTIKLPLKTFGEQFDKAE